MMSIKGKGRPARAGIVACLTTVAAVLLLPGAAQASSQDKFERQFVSYISEMGKVAASLEATPAGNAAFDQLGMDPARGTARARLEVKSMSSAELAVLRQAFSTIPGWRDQPDVLRKAVSGAVGRRGARRLKGVGPDCDPGPGRRSASRTTTSPQEWRSGSRPSTRRSRTTSSPRRRRSPRRPRGASPRVRR